MSVDLDLSLLPAPNIIEPLDYDTLFAQQKADLIALLPECAAMLALESEPLTKQLRVLAYRELLLRQRINESARALMLTFATAADLDHLGTTYHRTQRLLVAPGDPTAIPPVPDVWESDSDYRYRCTLAPSGYSVAGPSGAYEYHAMSASGLVKHADPVSPIPGSVDVYILSRTGNGAPAQSVLDAVTAALNTTSVRPLCEEVTVKPASILDYTIVATLTSYEGVGIELALATAQQQAQAYADTTHRIRHGVYLAGIKAALKVAGISDVVLTQPAADVLCGVGEAAYCTGITITYGGVKL
ncbi:Baseplate Assembly protein [Ferriphaselus amnicola]|uniref:Baseplate Assembly protein n=1 Tax=Ferriphaselus amnicola TaxID=1188319 RepID=A0A2Z6GCU5_9PROT|nr:baseplate J/gp47 family protein [Ferriphaselus amnicola]BBE51142.1 Baseplate Assembly protein [Ferriphaselus amnicola]